MGNPVTEFLELEKKGDWAQFGKQLGLAAATVGGMSLAGEVYQGIRGAVTRAQGFKRMMAYNPELEKEDRTKVQTIFNTLHNVAPDLARDPLVASSWVKQMAYQQEYVDPRVLSDLATAQQRMSQGRGGVSDLTKAVASEGLRSSPFGAKGSTTTVNAPVFKVPATPVNVYMPSGGRGGRGGRGGAARGMPGNP